MRTVLPLVLNVEKCMMTKMTVQGVQSILLVMRRAAERRIIFAFAVNQCEISQQML